MAAQPPFLSRRPNSEQILRLVTKGIVSGVMQSLLIGYQRGKEVRMRNVDDVSPFEPLVKKANDVR
jgi:hypothetical protein